MLKVQLLRLTEERDTLRKENEAPPFLLVPMRDHLSVLGRLGGRSATGRRSRGGMKLP